jgi:hypothetical protein
MFKVDDMVRVYRHCTWHNYGGRPKVGSIGIVRAYVKRQSGTVDDSYCILDIAPGGVYCSDLALYNDEWDV